MHSTAAYLPDKLDTNQVGPSFFFFFFPSFSCNARTGQKRAKEGKKGQKSAKEGKRGQKRAKRADGCCAMCSFGVECYAMPGSGIARQKAWHSTPFVESIPPLCPACASSPNGESILQTANPKRTNEKEKKHSMPSRIRPDGKKTHCSLSDVGGLDGAAVPGGWPLRGRQDPQRRHGARLREAAVYGDIAAVCGDIAAVYGSIAAVYGDSAAIRAASAAVYSERAAVYRDNGDNGDNGVTVIAAITV
eukprot:2027422-Rhodomonas_salina.2